MLIVKKIIKILIMIIIAYLLFMILRWLVLPKIRIFPYIYPEFLWVTLYNLFVALCHQVFAYILMFLIIMYVLWLIIKFFVPNFPIPFKKILLKLPPFPQLDQAGIFGLFEAIRKAIMSLDTLKRRLKRIGNAVAVFLIKSSGFLGQGLQEMGVTMPGIPFTPFDGKSSLSSHEQAIVNDEQSQCIEENMIPTYPEMNGVQRAKVTLQNTTIELACRAKTLKAVSNIIATRL